MTTLVQTVRRSLFFRLLLIFGLTVLFFLIIIWGSLQAMNRNVNVVDTIPDFFTRNIESIIEDIGTPPNLGNAVRLADELGWIINIRNPIMRWSSDSIDRLDVDASEFNRVLTPDAEVRTVASEDIIKVQRGGYDFFLYQRALENAGPSYGVLYVGLSLASLVLFANYFMVNRLLDPVRLLKRGAERIRKGDLSFRVKTNRQDELGQLTESINHMADSLQSMLEAKRQLLLAISHELRTPITRAKLRLEFMEESDVKEQLREDIDEIDLLISDLVEAERLNNAHVALSSEWVEIGDFVRAVTSQYESCAGGLELITPEPDIEVFIDRLRIRLLITNLMNNAIRHGQENPITLDISGDDEWVQLKVIDQGEGIAAEHLSKLSEPFYRADRSRQRNTGGFGLGLYLCRLIAEAHGGSLAISSKIGEGTQVTVKLPRHPSRPDSE